MYESGILCSCRSLLEAKSVLTAFRTTHRHRFANYEWPVTGCVQAILPHGWHSKMPVRGSLRRTPASPVAIVSRLIQVLETIDWRPPQTLLVADIDRQMYYC